MRRTSGQWHRLRGDPARFLQDPHGPVGAAEDHLTAHRHGTRHARAAAELARFCADPRADLWADLDDRAVAGHRDHAVADRRCGRDVAQLVEPVGCGNALARKAGAIQNLDGVVLALHGREFATTSGVDRPAVDAARNCGRLDVEVGMVAVVERPGSRIHDGERVLAAQIGEPPIAADTSRRPECPER